MCIVLICPVHVSSFNLNFFLNNFFFIKFVNFPFVEYQQCTTQDQRVGACIDARQCPSLVSQYALDYQCGGYGSTAVNLNFFF